MQKLRVTSAMDYVLHALLSLGTGAGMGLLTLAGQTVLQTGTNVPVVAGVGIAGVAATFVHGFVALVRSPQAAQAVTDVKAEAMAAVEPRIAALESAALSRLATLEQAHSGLASFVQSFWTAWQNQPAPGAPQTSAQGQQGALPSVGGAQPAAQAQAAAVPQQAFPTPSWMAQQSMPVAVPPR